MKKLSLVTLYKAEIKKNMLSQIKGGIDVKCFCSVDNPHQSMKKAGGPIGDLCICSGGTTTSATVQDKPSLI